MEWKDEHGAWVRSSEQRFRAFALGRITIEQFLDVQACYVFLESDLSASVAYDRLGLLQRMGDPTPHTNADS